MNASTKKKDDEVSIFTARLKDETDYLKRIFTTNAFDKVSDKIGFELEFLLLNNDLSLSPSNIKFIKKLQNPLVTCEGHVAQCEIHTTPQNVEINNLQKSLTEINELYNLCQKLLTRSNKKLLMIGSYPMGMANDFSGEMLTKDPRYHQIDEALLLQRNKKAINFNVDGETDTLKIIYKHLGLMGSINSLQIHLQAPADKLANLYNILHIVAGPVAAIATNSSYLMHKKLWCETRIPIFENLFSILDNSNKPQSRVIFGSGFLGSSLFDLFQENLEHYKVVLPIINEGAINELHHLRLHNSTVYRWIRPVIDTSKDTPMLRLEFRILPSGPSLPDMYANIVFLLGLVFYLMDLSEENNEIFTRFSSYKKGFYQCAQHGLDSESYWIDNKWHNTRSLLLMTLLPLAYEGLSKHNFTNDWIKKWLEIIEQRAITRQTGANWQEKFMNEHQNNFNSMLNAYISNQNAQIPVHQWSI